MANELRAFFIAITMAALAPSLACGQASDAREQPEAGDAVAIAQQCINRVKEQSARLGGLVKRCGKSSGALQGIVQAVVDKQLASLRGGLDCPISHRLEREGVVKLSGKAADPKKTLGEAQELLHSLPGLVVDASEVLADDCHPKKVGERFEYPLEAGGEPRQPRRGEIDGTLSARLPSESDCEAPAHCEGGCEGGAAAKEVEQQFPGRYSRFWITSASGMWEFCEKYKGSWGVNKNVAQDKGLLVLRRAKD